MKTLAPALALVALSCFGQTPAFEVASVKLFDLAAPYSGPLVRVSADSLTIHGLTLQNCIQMAWQLPEARVVAPEWLKDVHLEIVAKTASAVDEKQIDLMLQTLLADRLGVKAHIEKRETPVYALTVAKGGPKFTESATEGDRSVKKDKNGVNVMEHVTMGDLALVLSQGFGRPFVDATGLKGRYDLKVDPKPYMPTDGTPATAIDSVGIMITALQEQAGIKVESRKENVDMLIVDHAEKTPIEN